MPANKIVLIHGYSDQGKSFDTWAAKLSRRGIDAALINICNYISLNNEITIPDLAEGLNRAFFLLKWPADEPYDAIVHSTGMLVLRAYLCNDASRSKNLKHLIGLAPATWGSPLADQGRSFLGALFKGSKQLGPDFLNAGDQILDGLELGGEFTWDLAHRDLLSAKPTFTTGSDSPYVAVFIGNQPYEGIKELVDKPATDGTVRWAGCALNTRKFIIDLLRNTPDAQRVSILDWAEGRQSIPMFAVDGKNHGTILSDPEDDLADKVASFLQIDSPETLETWLGESRSWSQPALEKMKADKSGPNDGWQQFVFHVVDEYGSPVPDYVVDLFSANPTGLEGDALSAINLTNFDLDVHAYAADKSFRCFHVRLPSGVVAHGAGTLWLRLIASSGTELVGYQGYGLGAAPLSEVSPVLLDLSGYANGADALFCPFTTTLVEIRIHREPLPLSGVTPLMTTTVYSAQRLAN